MSDKDDLVAASCLGLTLMSPPLGLVAFGIFGAHKLWQSLPKKEPTPPKPPTREQLLADAKKRLYEELSFANSFADKDERESYKAGANARFRRRLGEITQE